VLDVGCGYGTFLAALADASTCELVGIDTDAGSIAHALRHERIRYECGGVDSAALEAGSFDAVTMFESLEHHRDPLEALRRALRLLKPGGVCVVEVPNWAGAWRRVFGSWWMPLLVPQHLYHFTPASLREAMVAAGFEVRDRHRSMFYPLESTASLALWLNEYMGRPIRRYRLQLRRPDGLLLVALLAAWWLAVELPAQAALMLAGRTGHQALVGFRPAEFR
jgi:SAM-dependent methyltransferase